MPTHEVPRESKQSLARLCEHHRLHRTWGTSSDVIVQVCNEALALMDERDEARTAAESLLRSERINMGRHTEHGPLPWQLMTCTECGGDGRDAEHHGVEILKDMDAIYCKVHGEVGRGHAHGMCRICRGKGKVPIEEAAKPANQPA